MTRVREKETVEPPVGFLAVEIGNEIALSHVGERELLVLRSPRIFYLVEVERIRRWLGCDVHVYNNLCTNNQLIK